MKAVVLKLLMACLVLFASLGVAVAHEQGTKEGPELGDFFSDRALLVSGWSSEELAKIATRSVGEKLSPLPWLSRGASVVKTMPESS